MMHCLLLLSSGTLAAAAASLWSSNAASWDTTNEAFLVGNGKLGAMPFAAAGTEKLNLNYDDLWSGGPFQVEEYRGGNPNASLVGILRNIRSEIWQTGIGNDSLLHGDESGYGSYHSLANLTVHIEGISEVTGYNRTLDLSNGIHTTSYSTAAGTYTTLIYCSYPDQVCVYHLTSPVALANVSVWFDELVESASLYRTTCGPSFTRLRGLTQEGPPIGMRYDIMAQSSLPGVCDNSTGVLRVGSSASTSLTLVIAAGTDFDPAKGNAANGFTFRGDDPAAKVEKLAAAAHAKPETKLRAAHVADYGSLANTFTLNLPDSQGSSEVEFSELITRYRANSTAGDPFLEKLMFDYGRHLFISSSRQNSLPPNLQGIWSSTLSGAWGADYHANINLQMNMWGAEATGLGELTVPLFNYMEQTWMPRGAESAQLIYGGDGWVTHDEMNIFGHTGMKTWQTSADYPAAPAWMMQHVWDHYDYSRDRDWLRKQGWPMLKGVAEFWLSQLQLDQFTNDNSLVVNPCTSPEHGPVTFGCTHWQQLIYQVFENSLQIGSVVQESDQTFLADVQKKLAKLDKGLHIGSWGEIKEWKLPDSYGYDEEGDEHRHLSHLVGWYPGWSISSYQNGYTNSTIQQAVKTSLTSRGPGISDSNAGWEKVWRSACWARLNNTEEAYYELRLTIDQNIGSSGLSLYSGGDTASGPFQIDANFGLVGAVLSMLVVDMPLASSSSESARRTVVLGPAIPRTWAGGSVRGLRVRGGGTVDFSWDGDGVVDQAQVQGLAKNVYLVNVKGKPLA
ncbi:Six-hairpin glycosidase-like protein [Penicillium canariense]|uniref:Six-hairpin glycosidase-like protein n=1 Tax=Penicillium canariense TaxID=189055 RepID=A0A9W9HSW0_9EURO|nr:Six-hairpin glycosidase-like protein [Penicillium canariense]KAJ5157178.1 Six-hairpin glycosidase-like protein [Penicillium canariense]